MGRLFIIPKESHTGDIRDEIVFSDLAHVVCPDHGVKDLTGKAVRPPQQDEGAYVVGIDELVVLARAAYPDDELEIVGSGASPLVIVTDSSRPKKPVRLLINVLVYATLFLGSALSVMYFHMDVSMLETFGEFMEVFSADPKEGMLVMSIFYSIGMGAGMYVFFRNRRLGSHKIPSPIDAKLEAYDKAVSDTLRKKTAKGEKP